LRNFVCHAGDPFGYPTCGESGLKNFGVDKPLTILPRVLLLRAKLAHRQFIRIETVDPFRMPVTLRPGEFREAGEIELIGSRGVPGELPDVSAISKELLAR
jgi:hypothetical protein